MQSYGSKCKHRNHPGHVSTAHVRQPVAAARRDTERAVHVCTKCHNERWQKHGTQVGDSAGFGAFNLSAIVLFGFLQNRSYLFLSN